MAPRFTAILSLEQQSLYGTMPDGDKGFLTCMAIIIRQKAKRDRQKLHCSS